MSGSSTTRTNAACGCGLALYMAAMAISAGDREYGIDFVIQISSFPTAFTSSAHAFYYDADYARIRRFVQSSKKEFGRFLFDLFERVMIYYYVSFELLILFIKSTI